MATLPGPWAHGDSPPDGVSRMAPHNVEAEQGVLGSILVEPATFKEIRPILRGPEDFFRDTHRTVYRVLCELADRGVPLDNIALADELSRQGFLLEIGGIELIGELCGSVPHAANAAYYAHIVRQKAERRDLIEAASEILRDGYANELASSELLARAKRKILQVEAGLAEQGWQPPELDVSHPAAPFPLDAFPLGFQRFTEEVSRSIPCPVDFAAVPALAVAGAAVGRSLALRVKSGWTEEANLWTAIVGMPGTGKTPPIKAVTRPLYKIFEEQLLFHQVEVEAARERRRAAAAERKKLGGKAAAGDPEPDDVPPLKRVLVGDATSEAIGLRLRDNPRGLILVLDELAGLINGLNQYKNGGGNDQEFYLALWSRASYPIDRKGQEGGIPIYVRSPFFAMTGGIQPDKLDSIGSTRDGRRLNDGFLDRFLFAFPREVPMRWTDEEVNPETEREWSDAVRRLWDRGMVAEGDGYERPYRVDFTAEARARYAEWFDENCKATEESDFPEQMKGPFSKVRAYCARLALVVEQVWWAFDPDADFAPPHVSLRSVEAAIRLVGYFESHYRRVMGFISGSNGENPDAMAIMAWLEGRDSARFTAREVKDNFRRRFQDKPGSMDAALAWLEDRGVVQKLPERHRPQGGRKPSPSFEINPSFLESARKTRKTNNPKS